MTLAYVFWHWPAPGVDAAAYEERLRAFHRALDLPGSRTYRLDRAPFTSEARYEDWYPVADWTQLGALNARAVDAARRGTHDAAARHAAGGAGGVYRRLADGREDDVVTWLGKPSGTPQEDLPALAGAAGAAVWQRQMVLGPAPELLVTAPADGLRVTRRRL